MDNVTKYDTGEKLCAGCKAPLPPVETWPGRRFIYCDKTECQEAARSCPTRRYVGEGEIKCQGPGCDNFVPAGSYDARYTTFACCGDCWRHRRGRRAMGNTLMTCACGCGETFRSGNAIRTNYFLNREHAGRFRTEQALVRCGSFLPLVREYLGGFAQLHYARSSRGTALTSLVVFCEFLTERGLTSMNDVRPKTITDYLVWGEKNARNQVAHSVSPLSIFFCWQIAEGYRELANPIVPSIHKTRRPENEPRPLSDDELKSVWAMLEMRGNARIRLATAIGEEAGLRISEIANIRLEDMDRAKQRIAIRTPTKNKKPRWAPFGEKTLKYLDAWLDERDPHCGHDHLFHGRLRRPSTAQSLRDEFNRFLTKRGSTYHNGHQTNPDGFDSWSTHRLRHTMASNLANGGADAATVMTIGGWKSFKSMCGYSKVDESVAQRGYETAMKRSKEQRAQKKRTRRVNLEELAQQKRISGK